MLGQPVYFLTPDVVGVHLSGRLGEGVTATDLVLVVTEMLRKAKVVGKFVEFFGEGAASLAGDRPRDDRQHGARVRRDDGLLPDRRGVVPVPARDRPHARAGRRPSAPTTRRRGSSGSRGTGDCDYTEVLELDLAPRAAERRRAQAAAGPHRPARPEDAVPRALLEARRRERLRQGRRRRWPNASPRRSAARPSSGAAARRRRASAAPSRANTNVWTESEMANNRPTPDRRRPFRPSPRPRRRRPRRRADRGDHLLHEHLEPERHARRRDCSRRRPSSAA